MKTIWQWLSAGRAHRAVVGATIFAALVLGLAIWAWIDFQDYQRDLGTTLQSLTDKADWRAAEAAQHAAGFAYGSMLASLFGLVISVAGIVVVGQTLISTIDLAFLERRPWLSITNIRDVKVSRISAHDAPIEFRVQATFDVRNSGKSPALQLCRFELLSSDDDDDKNLDLMKKSLHENDVGGHALTNIAPDRALEEITVAKTFRPSSDYDGSKGYRFLLGIRVTYGAESRSALQTSQIISIGHMSDTGDIEPMLFLPDGKPASSADFTSCYGGRMD